MSASEPSDDEKPVETSERKALARILYEFLGPAAKETGQLIADQVRLYRWRLAVKVLEKAEKYGKERNIKSGEIPYNFLVPFIEKASLADEDDELLDFWANLLVDASKKTETKHRVFLEILDKINQPQAILLRTLYHLIDVPRRNLWKEPLNFDRALDEIRKELQEFVKKIHETNPIGPPAEAFIALNEWWKSKKTPGLIVRQGVGIKRAGLVGFESPNDFLELGGGLFDTFNLCQLRLLQAQNFNFDVRKDKIGLVTIHIRAVILSPLGYAFVETCEGGKS